MLAYTGLDGWSPLVGTDGTYWGVQVCSAGEPALCEALARKVPGANYYSVSANPDSECHGCFVSKACSAITTQNSYAQHVYFQLANPVARDVNEVVDVDSSCRRVVTATVTESATTGWTNDLTVDCTTAAGTVVTVPFGPLRSGSAMSVYVDGITTSSCAPFAFYSEITPTGVLYTYWEVEVSTRCYPVEGEGR